MKSISNNRLGSYITNKLREAIKKDPERKQTRKEYAMGRVFDVEETRCIDCGKVLTVDEEEENKDFCNECYDQELRENIESIKHPDNKGA